MRPPFSIAGSAGPPLVCTDYTMDVLELQGSPGPGRPGSGGGARSGERGKKRGEALPPPSRRGPRRPDHSAAVRSLKSSAASPSPIPIRMKRRLISEAL